MKFAKIVIGANFGDEGKGLMTDYYASCAKKAGHSCLVVCHNGGSQRGHTVEKKNGARFIFHHFGSGCFEGAATYLSSDFFVNPIIFLKDHSALKEYICCRKCYVNPNCRFSTPFDMLINQIAEESRGTDRHGSCGIGIWETLVRYKNGYKMTVSEFHKADLNEKVEYLTNIADHYMPVRLNELGIQKLDDKWTDIISKKHILIENFIEDFENMMICVTLCNDDIIDEYDTVIFEGGQGLLLDEENTEYMPYLTPSKTGTANPARIIATRDVDTEVCYVTRTYITRHGAGRFDTECPKEKINPAIFDETNVYNEFQETLRFGILELHELKSRIEKDIHNFKANKYLAFTHVNEYPIKQCEIDKMFPDYGIYLSDGRTSDSIKKVK